MKQHKSLENTIIIGDFNAKMREGRQGNTTGQYGLGTSNESREHLAGWGKQNNIIIGNTMFRLPKRRRWTGRIPGHNIRNQIDYILIRERFRNTLNSAKTYPGADCGSDRNYHSKDTSEAHKIEARKIKQKA